METSRNSKRKTCDGFYIGEDRISALPDEMLCHILSYLPMTKEAVKSTILSKRWRLVWTSLPIITINDDLIMPGSRNYVTLQINFSKFVDRVLSLVSCKREFSLSCYYHSGASKWIRDVLITRDIEKLHLNIVRHTNDRPVELPLNLFTCKRLVDLRLGKDIRLSVPLPVNLPSLNTLHLHCIKSLDEDSVKNLLAGCPNLEKLVIVRVDDSINNLFIMSSSLKMFKLESVCFFSRANDLISLIIDAINLEEIDLYLSLPKILEVRSLPSIVKAKLNVSNTDVDTTIIDILRKISNVNHLSLSVYFSLDFANDHDLPTFPNLTSLKLETTNESCPTLQSIIECSPNLMSLHYILRNRSRSYYYQNDRFKKIDTPKNAMFHLEKIVIVLEGFHGRDHEMEMFAYFLKNFPALKTIFFNGVFDKVIRYKISMLPKVSENCEIIFPEAYFATI